jgi:uncharacterized membrane protein YdbT with pleckstrin-like domain
MAYPTKLLNPGEEIVLDLRPHWWAVTPQTVVLVASLIVGMLLLTMDLWQFVDILVSLGILVALGWAGVADAKWVSTNFVLTSERLIWREGVFAKTGVEIPIGRVNTVMFKQSVFERLLGAGDLVIESASEQGQQAFSNVRKPEVVQNTIQRQVEANERQDTDRLAQAVQGGGAGTGGSSMADELAKLSELHKSGVLSDAEFEQQKRKLLG